jgi:endonuclease/exonuclease/phosphatase family metal-dependent hydrolase
MPTALRLLAAVLSLGLAARAAAQQTAPSADATLRVATFNLRDVRTADLLTPDHPRLKRLAEVIQRLRPNVILLNEIAYDTSGAPGAPRGDAPGQNAARFCDLYLAIPQGPGLKPLHLRPFTAPVNAGVPSGSDLDHNGKIVTTYPEPAPATFANPEPEPSPAAREYAGDCWGSGTFPGQYGMALLVDDRLEVLAAQARTFRRLPWDYMPGAALPPGPDGAGSWLTEAQKRTFRLSSRSHWDVPVRLPNRAVIHFLCSHPVPPVVDGPEKRNARRNHDEIRFWADYIERAEYFVDDEDRGGPLDLDASFVLLGDLNADPRGGSAWENPVANILFRTRHLNTRITPLADLDIPGLDPGDTTRSGMRLDYVLPSTDLGIAAAGVWRQPPSGGDGFPSDHFPVWMDLVIRAPAAVPAAPGR